MSKKLTDEQKVARRKAVALELCAKDGHAWDGLDRVMRSAYLHNADCAIVDREEKVIAKKGKVASSVTCSICNDKGWIGGKACYDCNPVGLNPPEAKKEEPEPEKLKDKPVPKAGQYFCSKCLKVHIENKKLGQRHLKYKEVPDDNSNRGIGLDNTAAGSSDTGKPE